MTIPNFKLPKELVSLRKMGCDVNALLDIEILKLSNPEPEEQTSKLVLNEDQQKAFKKIKDWLATSDMYFALRGFAGTGKSTLMKEISELNYNFHFSAPTNKATKVLSDFIGVKCKTTYSLLGIRMVNEDDKKVLSVGPRVELGTSPILVIDESGMLNSNLIDLIVQLGYRVLFVGDPAQLNPIGEDKSKAWSLVGDNKALLRKVERFDNQLLTLSVKIRSCLKMQRWKSPIENDNSNGEGVFVKTRKGFESEIKSLKLEEWDTSKVCCWRNKTVEFYNDIIRESLGFKKDYEVGDRLLLANPLMARGTILAYTDEEFVISAVSERIFNFDDFSIEALVFDVDREFVLNVPKNPSRFSSRLAHLSGIASREKDKAKKIAWIKYWDFVETFSKVRYGYALTVHRLQGSTVQKIFMDQSDMLANPNKKEAFRCLYVAATRPKISLTTF